MSRHMVLLTGVDSGASNGQIFAEEAAQAAAEVLSWEALATWLEDQRAPATLVRGLRRAAEEARVRTSGLVKRAALAGQPVVWPQAAPELGRLVALGLDEARLGGLALDLRGWLSGAPGRPVLDFGAVRAA